MPGPIVHLVVEKRVARQIRRFDTAHPAADLLLAEPCSPYTSFGAMGPDYLFFSIDEYSQELQDFVDFVFGVYDAFQPLIDFYEDNIEPVVDTIEDAVNAVDDLLFQGLFQQIQDTADQVATLAMTAAAVGVTSGIDFFEFFKPPIQRGLPEDEWYWFDFLHYRRTGQYASRMWDLAQGDSDLMRYCLGYASHVATDVVGHPYVNTIVGGPYRMHWRRHKLVENWIDAYARKFYPDTAAIKKCLQLGPDDAYRLDAISSSYYYRLCEFENGKLPEKLAEMISKAMQDVYDPITHPSHLAPDSIDSIYGLWLKWFTLATSSRASRRRRYLLPARRQ